MKRYLPLILILVFSFPCYAQVGKLSVTYKNRTTADSYKENKRYDSAAIFYNKVAKDEVYADATDLVKLSFCNLATKDQPGFRSNLDKSIVKGADSSYIISIYRAVLAPDSSYFHSYLEANYARLRSEFIAGTDTSVIHYMDKIMELDQLVRASFKFDTNYVYLRQIGRFTDSVNFLRVKKLIEDGQYPGSHKYGLQASKYSIVLFHIADDEEPRFEYIFDFMKKQVLKGDMTIGEVRAFATRHYGNTGGKYGKPCNYYGTKSSYQKRWSDLPLCECDKVDELRKEIGLETIKEYYEKEKIALPECYTRKK
jgi:hypothetical protein